MKYAVKRLIDSVWTLGYEEVDEYNVRVFSYDRDNPVGYEKEKELPKLVNIENDERVLEAVEIDGKRYAVVNPCFIFSYRPLAR